MLEEKKRKLRIGLLIESISQPGWICRIIEDIEKSHFAEIVLIAKKEFHDHVRRFLPGLSINGYPLLWSLYTKIDKRYPCPYRDPFEQFDLSYLEQRGSTILSVRPIAVNGEYHLKEEDVQRIRSENVDVVLNFWGDQDHRGCSRDCETRYLVRKPIKQLGLVWRTTLFLGSYEKKKHNRIHPTDG